MEAALAREQTNQMTQQAIESGREAKTILFLTFVTIVFVRRTPSFRRPFLDIWSTADIRLGSHVLPDVPVRAGRVDLLRRACQRTGFVVFVRMAVLQSLYVLLEIPPWMVVTAHDYSKLC